MKQIVENKVIDSGSIYFTDINDSKVLVSDLKGKVVIIIGGAQKAAKESEKWGRTLKSIYQDSMAFINVAFIPRQPPAHIMPLVKNQLRKAFGKVPFLISWGSPSDIINIINEELTHIFCNRPSRLSQNKICWRFLR